MKSCGIGGTPSDPSKRLETIDNHRRWDGGAALYTMAWALLRAWLSEAPGNPDHGEFGGPIASAIGGRARPIALDWAATALVIIDMQRDFLEPGGFGETLGNDVSQLARAVEPTAAVLAAARGAGLLVVHTREGHLPDLSDAPPAKSNAVRQVFGSATPDRWDVSSSAAKPDTTSLLRLSGRWRDRHRQARQGCVLRDRSR